jgi:hypothetical protein
MTLTPHKEKGVGLQVWGVEIKKMRVLGMKPSSKKDVRSRYVVQETHRHCFNPTFLNVETYTPHPKPATL